MFPYLLDGSIIGQLWRTVAHFYFLLSEGFTVFVKYDRGNSFVLVRRLNTDEVKNNILAMLSGF